MQDNKKKRENYVKELDRSRQSFGRLDSIISCVRDAVSIQDTQCKMLYQNETHQSIFANHAGHIAPGLTQYVTKNRNFKRSIGIGLACYYPAARLLLTGCLPGRTG